MNTSDTNANHADHDARAFYQALHREFDATLKQTERVPTLIDALAGRAYDTFHGNVAIQCQDEPPLDCKRGCATCCTLCVSATAPEILLIARLLRILSPGLLERGIDLVQRVRDVDAKARGLDEAQRLALREFCPYIAQGVCVIHRWRPLACRGHASHDVKACVAAAAGRAEDVPYSIGHRTVRALVQNALQSSLRDAGLAWGMYEFNHAVLLALDDPDAEARWLAGEDVLAAAKQTTVSDTEMAEAYNQLRPSDSRSN